MNNIEKLKVGDTIGVFSPSAPISYSVPKRYERGKQYLIDKGFKVLEGSLTGRCDFYRSGSIKERAEELNILIRNPEVKCIMSTIGGMNSNSILPYIDYDELKKNPKIIIGYSDVTAILLAIYAKTGINTFYGPALAASFGEFPPFADYTFEYFKDIVMNDLNMPYTLLKLNGVFDRVSGIILGKHELFDDQKTGRKPYEILLEVLGDRKLPFIADFDCSHTHPMFTLPIGCEIELDATNKKVSIVKL